MDSLRNPQRNRLVDRASEYRAQHTRRLDLLVRDEGTIFLVHAISPRGHAWIAQHLPGDAPSYREAVVVGHRFISDIIEGAIGDGLVVLPPADIEDDCARDALGRYLLAFSKRTGVSWTIGPRVDRSGRRLRVRLFAFEAGAQATVRYRPDRDCWAFGGRINGTVRVLLDAPGAPEPDRWAQYNRRFNDLLMRGGTN
jgi:hypothetical protein